MKDQLLVMLLFSLSATTSYGQCGDPQPVPKVFSLPTGVKGQVSVGPAPRTEQPFADWIGVYGMYTYSADQIVCRLVQILGSVDAKFASVVEDQRTVNQSLLKRQENAETSLTSLMNENRAELSARIDTLEKQIEKLQVQLAGEAGNP
ncbi:hypothetical protein [Rhizobium phaseoli]|uniref:hypothetical protein n=1 Tax=Rhizobium phaseoli TaxID=396 RepID=UPI0007EBF966|nr:hypothetical protein [Rhizobium phaseoli]